MKLCISTYSFWQLLSKGEMNYHDCVDRCVEFGVPSIELVMADDTAGPDSLNDGSLEKFVLELVDYAHSRGLEVPIYTTGANFCCKDPEAEIARVEKHVDIASKAGIPLMRHDVMFSYGEGYEGLKIYDCVIPMLADSIRKVAEYAQTKGVMTCSENHGTIAQDSDRVLKMLAAVNHPNYRYLCDIGNFACADENCSEAVAKLLPFIKHVHAKDMHMRSGMLPDPGEGWFRSRGGNYLRGAVFGQGDEPAYQSLKLIFDSGYRGYVSLEFEGMEPCLEAIRISLDNLRRYIASYEKQN